MICSYARLDSNVREDRQPATRFASILIIFYSAGRALRFKATPPGRATTTLAIFANPLEKHGHTFLQRNACIKTSKAKDCGMVGLLRNLSFPVWSCFFVCRASFFFSCVCTVLCYGGGGGTMRATIVVT